MNDLHLTRQFDARAAIVDAIRSEFVDKGVAAENQRWRRRTTD